MLEKIYNILVSFLGESKQGRYFPTIEQYQFNCCGQCMIDNGGEPDGKHNLEVLLSENGGLRYHCWKCSETNNMKGNLSSLIKKYGGYDLYLEYKNIIQDMINSKMYNIDTFSGFTESIIEEKLKLPKTFKHIDIKNCNNKQLISFLNYRKINQNFIDKFNIGYTEWNGEAFEYRNKIVIPSYDSFGELNYFICRDYTGKSKFKYRNSNRDKKEIIFLESMIDWDAPIYLCEGVFDAMRLPLNGISMLGKTLSKDCYLFKNLYKNANSTITIILDGDTTENETKRIYKSLNFGRLNGKIRYINMSKDCNYKDISELYENEGKYGIINLLKKQKKYSELDFI